MSYLVKNLLIAFMAFLIIAGLFTLLNGPKDKPTEISLSQLVEQINQEQVATIIAQGDQLEIELKDGTKEKATKEKEASLTESLKNYGVDSEKLKSVNLEVKGESGLAFWLGAILPFLLPLIIIGFFFWFMFRGAQRGQMQAFTFGRSRARLVDPRNKKDRITFKDVAGLKEAKEELQEIVEFLRSPKKFIDIGAKIPKGVLLIGPPGTGKTLLARAVASEAHVPFFSVSGSEFVEMFVGVGSSRVRDLFQTAKKSAPALIFIDELDAIGRQRGAGLGGGHDEREQTLNQILVEMDGFDPNTGIILLAATNRPDVLDPALLRPGRFDRRVALDLPDIKDREDILKIHARDKPLEEKVNLREIAERTPGFSGADLANLVNEAAILTARQNKKKISQNELRECIEKVLLGPERKSHILSKKEKEIAAFHEAGHALVSASLSHADPVQKISIISRGQVAGYTLKLPTEDRHLHSRSEFIDELAVFMGGYVAEKIVFDELTTGASNDLQQATELARNLVTKYGMSDKLGPRTFGGREEMIFLGREIATGKDYSEEAAGQIDKEVSRFIDQAFHTAKKILTQKRKKLDQIAQELIKKEAIERQEFERLMKQKV
ncbi:MAG: ATP-dependent zinc metalloprotease FtsH [Patescibacteria group bacterium]